MKKQIRLFLPLNLLIGALFLLAACNSPSVKEKEIKEPETKPSQTIEDTVKMKAYVCPMGPQCGQSDSAGKCPSCGMDMKSNPKFRN